MYRRGPAVEQQQQQQPVQHTKYDSKITHNNNDNDNTCRQRQPEWTIDNNNEQHTLIEPPCIHTAQEKSLWNYVSLHSIDLEGQIRPSKEELEIICAE